MDNLEYKLHNTWRDLEEAIHEVDESKAIWFDMDESKAAILIWDEETKKHLLERDMYEVVKKVIASIEWLSYSEGNKKIVKVDRAAADKGWGQTIYEIGMVLNGQLQPDDRSVSDEAKKAWLKMTKRPDMKVVGGGNWSGEEWDKILKPSNELKNKVKKALNNKASKDLNQMLNDDEYDELFDTVNEAVDQFIYQTIKRSEKSRLKSV
jgi:methyl-accepting chemotaxis protein